jgi:hypothetical protein
MRNPTLFLVALAAAIVCDSVWLAAGSIPSDDHAASSYAARAMPRVRSTDATVARLITRAYALSLTFRRVVDSIDATNGIVYVQPGRCRLGRACLLQSVTVAGPHRILRIVVDPRKAADDCDLMGSIGHELWHAWEVLSDASLTSDAAMYFFYERARASRQLRGVESSPGVWETEAARRAGLDVRTDLQNHRKATGNVCGSTVREDV